MKKIRYNGLGFPIDLIGVKTRIFRGEILPDLNHRELEDRVFKILLWHHALFTGSQLSFIRGYMKLSQKKFAAMLGLKTHATISGWESKGNRATGMPGTTELVIRLLMAELIKEDSFASQFKEFLGITYSPKHLEMQVA